MTPTQLATVVALALRDGAEAAEPDEPEYPFLVEVESGQVATGQKVVIYWRNKDRPAHFLQLRDNRVVVLYDGEERNIRPDLVRLPEAGEFSKVAENINEPSGV